MKKKQNKMPFVFPELTEDQIGTDIDIKHSCLRGKVIHYMIELEELIEWIIIEYYVIDNETKTIDFKTSVYGNEGFGIHTKYMILGYILTNEYQSFKESKFYLLTTLDEMISLRNKYAHHGVIYDETLLHTRSRSNKLNLLFTPLSERELKIFYGKFAQIKSDLKELYQIIKKDNKKGS